MFAPHLSSQLSLPEMKGRRKMRSWRRFFAAWRPERAPSAAGLGYCNGMKIFTLVSHFQVFKIQSHKSDIHSVGGYCVCGLKIICKF